MILSMLQTEANPYKMHMRFNDIVKDDRPTTWICRETYQTGTLQCVEVCCSVSGGSICRYSMDPCHVLQCVAVWRSDLESVESLTPQGHGAGEDKCIYIYLSR